MAEIPLNIDVDEDMDDDSAAMAAAMGFTGFGSQRPNNKRKFNPHADAMADFSSGEPSAPAITGANNAPLGQRRPMMNLPPPSSGAGDNADEIDLADEGGDEDGARWRRRGGGSGGGGDDVDGDGPGPQYIDASRPPRDILYPGASEETEMQARINALVASSANPPGAAASNPEPQRQRAQAGKGARWSGPHAHAHAAKAAGLPWWEGAWDPKLIERMIENPWEKLEKLGGLEPRDTWGWKDGGGTAGMTAVEEAGTQATGAVGEAVFA